MGEIPGQARNEEERARNEEGANGRPFDRLRDRPGKRQRVAGPSTGSGTGRLGPATGLLLANNAYLYKLNGVLHALRLVEMTRGTRLAEMTECK